jgi:hypothetical protein
VIRRDLDDIAERDLQELCDSGREEDDRIEFKRSFAGGSDLISFSEPQRERAVESLAREVTALLNAKGGDLIIGIKENEGVAQELTPIESASEAAERLRRSLGTRIEPTPRAMRIRSIPAEDSKNGAGYIVIRAESSLQAPHRITKSKEFYLRRGTEASPMNIIEVHDLTLNTRTASARIEDKLRSDLVSVRANQANNRVFHGAGFQIRVVYAPLQPAQIPLDGSILHALTNPEPTFYDGPQKVRNDVAFRSLEINWRPVLRGKLVERWIEGDAKSRAGYAAKRIHSDGTVVFDWFVRYLPEGANTACLRFDWYQGFIAEICHNLDALRAGNPSLNPGILGLAIRSELHAGNLPLLLSGSGMFQEDYAFPALERMHELPYFTVSEKEDLNAFFMQAQEDLLAIAGTSRAPASLVAPTS